MRYHVNIFLISPQKHMLWVLIRSASEALLMSTHSICFCGETKKYQCFLFEKRALYGALHIFLISP